eukprot:CAMPEP_0179488778 /NCGR_PEP_ID=MMETSP0799-20121207/64318_1 /TAXON_ID=46947 /ORGANISM="Geminigera cryophila, Strain CCMP2564" /LENGTH=85 /DNA_ID=CAMNT_0021304349 /DNA_START=460 /DNA_END=714 /DNA_ORIENTATION=-
MYRATYALSALLYVEMLLRKPQTVPIANTAKDVQNARNAACNTQQHAGKAHDAQPDNARPADARPTNASPDNARPDNARPTHART